MKAIYQANDRTFVSYLEAVRYADSIGCDVIQIDNGQRRWTPAVKPSAAKMSRYREQKAAYEAQGRVNSRKIV